MCSQSPLKNIFGKLTSFSQDPLPDHPTCHPQTSTSHLARCNLLPNVCTFQHHFQPVIKAVHIPAREQRGTAADGGSSLSEWMMTESGSPVGKPKIWLTVSSQQVFSPATGQTVVQDLHANLAAAPEN